MSVLRALPTAVACKNLLLMAGKYSDVKKKRIALTSDPSDVKKKHIALTSDPSDVKKKRIVLTSNPSDVKKKRIFLTKEALECFRMWQNAPCYPIKTATRNHRLLRLRVAMLMRRVFTVPIP